MNRIACGLLAGLLLHVPVMAQNVRVKSKKPARYDAAVEVIMVPSDDPRFAGLNPAVHEPRVVIRNNGLESLQAISIMYGTDGFKQRMFAWNGHIGSGLTAEVKLTHLIDMRPGANTFTVKLGDPNGRKDKNPLDNLMSTTFTAADLLGTRFTLRLRTAAGNGGWLHLESTRGRVLIDRSWSAVDRDTVLSMDVDAEIGAYVLQLGDSTVGPHSSLRILDEEGRMIQHMNSGPKAGTVYQFRVEQGAVAPTASDPDIGLHMLPGRGRAQLDCFINDPAPLDYTAKDHSGKVALEGKMPGDQRAAFVPIDLSEAPVGRYTVVVERDGVALFTGEMDVKAIDP